MSTVYNFAILQQSSLSHSLTSSDKKRDRSSLLRQTSASLAKRSDKVRKQASSEEGKETKETTNTSENIDLKNEISIQYRLAVIFINFFIVEYTIATKSEKICLHFSAVSSDSNLSDT